MKNKNAIKEMWYEEENGWWIKLKPEYGWGVNDNSVVNGENYEQLCAAMEDVHKKEEN